MQQRGLPQIHICSSVLDWKAPRDSGIILRTYKPLRAGLPASPGLYSIPKIFGARADPGTEKPFVSDARTAAKK